MITTSFSMDKPTLKWLDSWCINNRPRAILEFGSGVSTLHIARYCIESDDPVVFTSVEHHPEYYIKTYRTLKTTYPQDDPVGLRHCGIRDGWYDIDPVTGWDLIVIDGPPESIGREQTSERLQGFLEAGKQTTILVDDAKRPTEDRLVREWFSVDRRVRLEEIVSTPRGLAVLRVH